MVDRDHDDMFDSSVEISSVICKFYTKSTDYHNTLCCYRNILTRVSLVAWLKKYKYMCVRQPYTRGAKCHVDVFK